MGDFKLARFFFFRPLLVQECFFAGETHLQEFFFFQTNFCFVCHLLIKKNYFYKRIVVLRWF